MELVLTYLPEEVEAIHQIGSNAVVMNKRFLEALLARSKNRSEINAYIFLILLREYLRSLGVLDEVDMRKLVVKVVEEALGEDHIAYRMIPKLFQEEYRDLGGDLGQKLDDEFKYAEDFDRENARYIA